MSDRITPFDEAPVNAEWRVYPLNDNYEVSEYGHLRRAVGGSNSKKGKIIRPSLSKERRRRIPYIKYTISRDAKEITVLAHRIVAITFIGVQPSDDHEVAHQDGIGTNCHRSNLAWKTKSDNAEDKRRHGTLVVGERVNTNKLTAAQVLEIRASNETQQALADRFGVRQANISDIRRGRSWRHLL